MFNNKALLLLSTVVSMSVVGCGGYNLHSDSEINTKRVEVESGLYSERFQLSELDDGAVRSLAHHYYRYNSGQPVDLIVLYDPKSRSYTASKAAHDGMALVESFRSKGLRNVSSQVLPVKDASQNGGEVLVRFSTVHAEAPTGCGTMNGFEGKKTQVTLDGYNEAGYEYGCTVESLVAKQIARPGDLVGDVTHENVEGRRAVNNIGNYVYGVPNEPLEGGLEASEE